jgi:hypothetical protein
MDGCREIYRGISTVDGVDNRELGLNNTEIPVPPGRVSCNHAIIVW